MLVLRRLLLTVFMAGLPAVTTDGQQLACLTITSPAAGESPGTSISVMNGCGKTVAYLRLEVFDQSGAEIGDLAEDHTALIAASTIESVQPPLAPGKNHTIGIGDAALRRDLALARVGAVVFEDGSASGDLAMLRAIRAQWDGALQTLHEAGAAIRDLKSAGATPQHAKRELRESLRSVRARVLAKWEVADSRTPTDMSYHLFAASVDREIARLGMNIDALIDSPQSSRLLFGRLNLERMRILRTVMTNIDQ